MARGGEVVFIEGQAGGWYGGIRHARRAAAVCARAPVPPIIRGLVRVHQDQRVPGAVRLDRPLSAVGIGQRRDDDAVLVLQGDRLATVRERTDPWAENADTRRNGRVG